MLFSKWLIYRVAKNLIKYSLFISTLIIFFESTGLSQIDWTPIGTQDGLRFEINPTTYKSGTDLSVVFYQLRITNSDPSNTINYSIIDIIARCNSKLQALSKIETFNHQGRLVTSRDFDITLRDAWETPIASDIYGNAYNIACNSR